MVGWMPGFFDIEERLRELSAKGDDLECIKGLVDFGKFRADLEAAVPRADRSRGGRPPFDHVFMFKVLILPTMHALSDERCEYLIKDRLSFMRFLVAAENKTARLDPEMSPASLPPKRLVIDKVNHPFHARDWGSPIRFPTPIRSGPSGKP